MTKECSCGGVLVPLRSTDTKICSDCKTVSDWPLEPGQKPDIDTGKYNVPGRT